MHGFRVDLPGAKDPDEYVATNGPEALTAALEHRQSLVEWVVDRKLAQYADQTAAGPQRTAMSRERVLEDLRDLLALLPHSLVEPGRRADRHARGDRARVAKHAPRPQEAQPTVQTAGWRPHRDMVHVFWLLVHRYDQVADLVQACLLTSSATTWATHGSLARLLSGEPVAAVINEEP
ncbi:MAG: hypothetical protein H6736_12215 [Alphaproteobacteria bacterium]|nr:hypothetical protein [Alphaproteobacteria bacterium]